MEIPKQGRIDHGAAKPNVQGGRANVEFKFMISHSSRLQKSLILFKAGARLTKEIQYGDVPIMLLPIRVIYK